jgi:phytoene dehydrogenase-like protein
MADASYDAVFIGGGSNALVTALYLARNGMKVGVFDRRNEIGGEFCTDELPLPGFLMNTCAAFIRFHQCPAYYDFDLKKHGLALVMPGRPRPYIFDDETALVIWSTKYIDMNTGKTIDVPGNFKKNIENIRQFSERDAETCETWAEKFSRGLGEKIQRWLYNPPELPGEKSIADEIMESDEIDPRWPYMTIGEMAYDIFESDAMRVYFMRLAQGHHGFHPHVVLPLMSSLRDVGVISGGIPATIPVGGTHNIAHALQRALSLMGGDFFVSSEVGKILVESGEAKGIRLVNGSEIEAKKLVVSGVDPYQMAFRLLDSDLVNKDIKHKIKNLVGDNNGLMWATFALHELPKYKVASTYPEVMTPEQVFLSPKNADYFRFRKLGECHRNGLPSYFFFHMSHDTAFVPSYAPPGKHLCLVEENMAEDSFFTREEWEDIRKRTPTALLKGWQRYAPNMTPDNVIGTFVLYGVDLLDRFTWLSWYGISHTMPQMGSFRPIPEWSHYKTHIKNLYLCGQTQHPGGGSWGLPGYNCYKVIAEDLGLEKVWEKAGRPF